MAPPKIGTFTLNPAVDLHGTVDRVESGSKLRIRDLRREPGGGGINVARVLHRLDAEVLAIFTSGEPTGPLLEDLLEQEGVPGRALCRGGPTRENLTVYEAQSDERYRFTLPGPEFSDVDLDTCCEETHEEMPDFTLLVISGSVPDRCDPDIHARLIRDARESGTRVILDTSGDALARAVEAGPHVLKPNLRELGALTESELEDDEAIEAAARDVIQRYEIEALVVSIGAGGAILVDEQRARHLRAPTVPIRSRIGAGDSMVAGIAYGLSRDWSLEESTVLGLAAGSAAVMTEGSRLCRAEDVWRLHESMLEENDDDPHAGSTDAPTPPDDESEAAHG